ncbi:hypothetical protein XELAEV_18000521mg [Xenopus laevis]|uniref:Uncharacterized protein n=1 Tax=Xenopus laevis TaxID=8355 RepID=A0A974BNX2_XENLA|nr:hypothetical protein XELAEV_18000521mg [Xenopus laevis]
MMKFRFRRQGHDPQREKIKQELFSFNKVGCGCVGSPSATAASCVCAFYCVCETPILTLCLVLHLLFLSFSSVYSNSSPLCL